MHMKISLNNKEKVEKALAKINQRATTYTINDVETLREVAQRAEAALIERKVPKRLWRGIKVRYTPEGPGKTYARKGYKYITTTIIIEHGATTWFLVYADKIKRCSQNIEVFAIFVRPKVYELAADNCMQNFYTTS